MRKSRTLQCFESSGLVHKFWKCHNSEFLLKHNRIKSLYNQCSKKALEHKSVSENIEIQAFCYMDNHVHLLCSYKNGVEFLSKFMQLSHSRFGMAYNKLFNRQGKVAIERPKTPVVEEGGRSQIYVHMYIEANPLRAGVVKNLSRLKNFRYSSYQYYAHGVKNEFTSQLTDPLWYLDLGETAEERQLEYVKLFAEYLNTYGWAKKTTSNSLKIKERSILRDLGSREFIKHRSFILMKYKNKKQMLKCLSPKELLEMIFNEDSS